MNFYDRDYFISTPITTLLPQIIDSNEDEINEYTKIGTSLEQIKEFESLVAKNYDFTIEDTQNFNYLVQKLEKRI